MSNNWHAIHSHQAPAVGRPKARGYQAKNDSNLLPNKNHHTTHMLQSVGPLLTSGARKLPLTTSVVITQAFQVVSLQGWLNNTLKDIPVKSRFILIMCAFMYSTFKRLEHLIAAAEAVVRAYWMQGSGMKREIKFDMWILSSLLLKKNLDVMISHTLTI